MQRGLKSSLHCIKGCDPSVVCSLSLLSLGTVVCAQGCLDLQSQSATNPVGVGRRDWRLLWLWSRRCCCLGSLIPQKFLVVWDGSPEGSTSMVLVESSGVPQGPEFPGWFGGHLATGVKNQHVLDKLSAPTKRIKDDFTTIVEWTETEKCACPQHSIFHFLFTGIYFKPALFHQELFPSAGKCF